jgi:hypothetical protein
MAGPGLPVNVDTTYSDAGTVDVRLHQQHHDGAHGVVNLFDIGNVASAGFVPVGTGSVFVARPLLSTDVPGIVQSAKVASYTLVIGDAGTLVEMNVASANLLNVPANSTVAFPIGTQIAVRQVGAGVTTVTPVGTATVVSRGSLVATAGQWAEAVLTKRATDQWVLSGDIA